MFNINNLITKKENNQNEKVKIKNEETPKIKNIKMQILAIAAILLFSAAVCPVTFQNDTYYTIKIGEHIVNTGTVDMQDPFSWHEDLPYTYPHWAYDVMIYLIYNMGGFLGIFISTIVLSCILGILIYLTNCKISGNKLISFVITIGAMYLLKPYITARAQLVTFILLELTVLFIEKFLESKKKRYAIGIILISIAIANLHCAVWPFFFVLFLPYVVEYVVFTIIDAELIFKLRKKYYECKIKIFEKIAKKDSKYSNKVNNAIDKIEELKNVQAKIIANREKSRKEPYKIRFYKNNAAKWLIVIMIICAFTGLLTPLGDTPYTYLYKTMIGNTTKSISEHLPLTLIENKEMLIVLAVLVAMLVFTDVKIRLKDLFMISGLALLMFMTRRQESMFVIFGSAIAAKIIAIMLIAILLSVIEIRPKLDDQFVSTSTYPVDAAQFIKDNLDLSTIRLFNEYNYGSYLIFEGIPVFIDSRADLYAPEFNGVKGEDGEYEGRDIFSDYISTSNIAKYYENTFEKYDITHVILSKNSKLNMLISRDSNYEQLYTDSHFVIYERVIN